MKFRGLFFLLEVCGASIVSVSGDHGIIFVSLRLLQALAGSWLKSTKSVIVKGRCDMI